MENTFTSDYNHLVNIAGSLLKKCDMPSEHKYDLVAECYIISYNDPGFYNKESFILLLKSHVRKFMRHLDYTCDLENNTESDFKTKICKECQSDLPTGAFYQFFSNQRNKTILSGVCKMCNSKIVAKWQRENKQKVYERNRRWQIKNLRRFCEYQRTYNKKYPEVVRKRKNKWAQKQRFNLTDPYIKKLFGNQGVKAKDVTQEMIHTKRASILTTREYTTLLKKAS